MSNKIYIGSDILLESLIFKKVKYIFGYPGGAILPVYDSLFRYSKHIRHILTRHEQGAIHAAQGYARVSGKVGVCISTSGPGATNLITGLADAFSDSTPIVCITGQVASNLLGTDSFQETNIIDISLPITKWNFQITKTCDIFFIIQKAFYIASSGRPGPVLIDITKDAQIEKDIFYEKKYYKEKSNELLNFLSYPSIQKEKIEIAAKLINKSKKPLILIGQGISIAKAEKEFKNFLEKTGIPVASTLLGLGIINSNHPLFVGMLGMHGNYAPNILTNKCDVIIAIGMRFDDRVTGDINKYAKKSKIIHLEIQDSEIEKNIKCHISILGNCKEILPFLTKIVNKNSHIDWLNCFKIKKKIEDESLKRYINSKRKSLNMIEVIKLINKYKNKNSVLVTDVGQHQMIASRYFNFSSRNSQITSGGLGTMGFALPASIGAQFVNKKRQIICIVGDGGFQMTIQELGTILNYKLPIKIILLNNNSLGMVRQWQDLFFNKRFSFEKLINPNFIDLVKSYGIKSKKITERNKLKESIKEIMQYNKTYFLEILVEKKYNVFPMIPSGSSINEIRLS